MSVAGDARFLSWNVFLEPFKRIHRVRYILFFDIQNHKLLLINCANQQSSSYDFSCVSNCKISDKNRTLLTLYLKNTKQSYTVGFYFDSNYDRNCGNDLLNAIITKTILKTVTKYGVADEVFQIGCQVQHIANRKPKKITQWQPRILSLIQNRILLFRDKSTDYHPQTMISLNERNFKCYKTASYDHTIQIHMSHNMVYQLHLGDTTALNSLITKLKSSLTVYNKRALSRFHPDKLPMNKVKKKIESGISPTTECTEQNQDQSEAAVYKAHEYMQSDTDDNETDTGQSDDSVHANKTTVAPPETTTTVTHTFRFGNMANNSQSTTSHTAAQVTTPQPQPPQLKQSDPDAQAIAALRYRHFPQFSNQTECKLQHPMSPISDALEPYKIVKNIALHLLKQSSPISVIDQDGNEVHTNIRNPSQSRIIDKDLVEEHPRIKATQFYGQNIDRNQYKRGSIDNIQTEPVKSDGMRPKKGAPCAHLDCDCTECGHDAKAHDVDPANALHKRQRRNRRSKQRRSRSQTRSKSKRKSKRKSAVVLHPESPNTMELARKKRAASYVAKIGKPLPKLPPKRHTKEEKEEEKREITQQPMALQIPKDLSLDKASSNLKLQFQRAESMVQKAFPLNALPVLQKANTLNPLMMQTSNYSTIPDTQWRYTTRPQTARIGVDAIQMALPFKIRSKSAGNVGKTGNTNQYGSGPHTPRYYPPHIYKSHSYYDTFSPTSNDTKPTIPSLPPPPPPPHDEEIDEFGLLSAPKWDTPLDISDCSKLATFIWGQSDPKTMFPGYQYPTKPWNCDNLYQKQIFNVSVAKEGSHCFGIGANDWCFVWGKATHIGVLGLGTNIQETTPFLVRSLRKEVVKQTCCSALHSLCITGNEVIYGWGSKRLTNLSSDTNIPTPLQFLSGKGLRYICACNTHSLAYDRRSIHIYSWGMPGPWLGYDNDNTFPLRQATFGLIKFNGYIYSNKYKILSADCSSQYTLILLNTGYVGCCGFNEHGRMAIGKHVISSSKVLWSTSANLRNIVRISAGAFHSGFVDMEGTVYTSGVGRNYRLGHENTDTIYKPQIVRSLIKVKVREIECVDATTYVITTCGQLVLFGKEPMTNKVHKTPFMLKHLSASYRVYNVCASKDFCVLSGCKIKQPLAVPDIDHLNQSLEDEDGGEIVKTVPIKKVNEMDLRWRQEDEPPIAFSQNNLNTNYSHAHPGSYKRNYNHWMRNYNRSVENMHRYTSSRTKKEATDDHRRSLYTQKNTQFGRCNQANCRCTTFVESDNKWNKGKCKSCSHAEHDHKKITKYRKYYYRQNQKHKQQMKYPYK
eukprot:55248_1